MCYMQFCDAQRTVVAIMRPRAYVNDEMNLLLLRRDKRTSKGRFNSLVVDSQCVENSPLPQVQLACNIDSGCIKTLSNAGNRNSKEERILGYTVCE